MAEADYIIVGAGSAGSALAYRLAEAGSHRITIIEHGGTDFGPFIQMPSALSYPMNMSHYDWGFHTEPEPHLGGRRLATPRGKVIGGSSSINGMVYVRGHAEDFDAWEALGAKGWGYRHVLPYFKRQEILARRRGRVARRQRADARPSRTAQKPALSRPSSRRATRPATASPRTTTAIARRASGPWR